MNEKILSKKSHDSLSGFYFINCLYLLLKNDENPIKLIDEFFESNLTDLDLEKIMNENDATPVVLDKNMYFPFSREKPTDDKSITELNLKDRIFHIYKILSFNKELIKYCLNDVLFVEKIVLPLIYETYYRKSKLFVISDIALNIINNIEKNKVKAILLKNKIKDKNELEIILCEIMVFIKHSDFYRE